jgi:hypothetical protein
MGACGMRKFPGGDWRSIIGGYPGFRRCEIIISADIFDDHDETIITTITCVVGADEFVMWVWLPMLLSMHAVSWIRKKGSMEMKRHGGLCRNDVDHHIHPPSTIQLRSRLSVPILIDDYDCAQRDDTTSIPTRRQILQWGSIGPNSSRSASDAYNAYDDKTM